MKKRLLSLLLVALMLFGTFSVTGVSATAAAEPYAAEPTALSEENNAASISEGEDLTQYVDMRLGTNTSSLCLIGPTRPNASVHPGPNTVNASTGAMNSYTGYNDGQPIRGFSQLHIQAGEGRYGNFLISPQVGLATRLDGHDSEKANENPTASEYSVTLERYGIDCAFTPAENSVIYKFTYPESSEASIVIDMAHHIPIYENRYKVQDISMSFGEDENGNTTLSASAFYNGHGSSGRMYYFYAVFDKAPTEVGVHNAGNVTANGTLDMVDVVDIDAGMGAYLKFDTAANETVMMKVGFSFTSVEKAKSYLDAEIPAFDYDAVKNETKRQWNEKLGTIEVSGLTDYQKQMFYSCLYDTFMQPRYRTGDYPEYGDAVMLDDHVATWDTFRTLYPLLTITNPQLVTDTIASYIARFEVNGDIYDLFATGFERPNGNQGGDNIDNIIVEAYLKGLIPEDMLSDAYAVLKHDAEERRLDRNTSKSSSYRGSLGYIPGDGDTLQMCCNTQLEYCYNDYLAAQMALGMGDDESYEKWLARSDSWQNIWNPNMSNNGVTGFIWPKNADGTWVETNSNLTSPVMHIGSWKPYFYEGTPYEYSFFVPHNVEALIEKMGGEEAFIDRLKKGIENGWIDAENQPGFLQAFLFNHTSEPWHTSDCVESIINRFNLTTTPGCEDSGSMCAWYVFANVGFFPSAGQDFYYLTSPKYESTTFNLDNGNRFTVTANNLSDTNKYIQSVTLNGVKYHSTTIKHSDIVNGGTLVYEMGSAPVNYTYEVTAEGECADGNYTWTIFSNGEEGILSISGTGDGTLRFDSDVNWNSLGNIPWSAHKDEITRVEIAETTGITSVAAYGLSNLPNCKTIIIPSTLTNLGNSNVFAYNTSLDTIAVEGEKEITGVFDLTRVVSLDTQLFEGSSKDLEIDLKITNASIAPIKWFTPTTTVNFTVNYGSSAEAWVNNAKNGTSDTRDSAFLFDIGTLSYITFGINESGHYGWSYDVETKTLTFERLVEGAWCEIDLRNDSSSKNGYKLKQWITPWKNEIEHIVIPHFDKLACEWSSSPFQGMKALKSVTLDTTRLVFPNAYGSLFGNCTALTTFGTSSNLEEGVVKLAGYRFENVTALQKLFGGCTSITTVDLTDALTYSGSKAMSVGASLFEGCTSLTSVELAASTAIAANAFKNCTSLREITVPDTVTSIAADAFAGCTGLKTVNYMAESFTEGAITKTSFPDIDGLYIYCQNNDVVNAVNKLGYTKTKAINANITVIPGIEMEGYSVRIKGYNGLRGLFKLDKAAIAANAENGLTLVEYGGILASEANKTAYGMELTFDGTDFVTANESVAKLSVWHNGGFVGNYLEENANEVSFAIAVVNYANNWTTNVCMVGYSIWQDISGNTFIKYVDYDGTEYDAVSIYGISLGMYKDGNMNAALDTEEIVWDTLVAGGAVTLYEGTDYVNSAVAYEADGTTPKTFGETFYALDVPCVSQSVSSGTFTCTNMGSTYSLFHDGDSYVIIFKAGNSGSNPTALPASAGNVWGAMYQPQYSHRFAPSATKIVNAPNPIFTQTFSDKITFAVIDSGITKLLQSTFYNSTNIRTVVYPETLASIERWAFTGSKISTMYLAGTSGENIETGYIDLGDYTGTLDQYFTFHNAKSFTKLRLPSGTASLGIGVFNSCEVKKIWVGSNPEPSYDGIADFANVSGFYVNDSSFQRTPNINLIKLPDNATINEARAFESTGSKAGGLTLWTSGQSDTVGAAVEAIKNGAVYTTDISYITGDEALESYIATKYGS